MLEDLGEVTITEVKNNEVVIRSDALTNFIRSTPLQTATIVLASQVGDQEVTFSSREVGGAQAPRLVVQKR